MRDDRLSLVATFPPKPNANSDQWRQSRLALGLEINLSQYKGKYSPQNFFQLQRTTLPSSRYPAPNAATPPRHGTCEYVGVRRIGIHSMSGGEKSLTALSFIFALQRYRPSPFYAFDEVDMFLDGANVQRLANMIQQQAQEAQFIVVSLRCPMIEAAMRTIGVTQARGAYTQVLGIKL